MKRAAVVLLAPGFETIEGLTPVDVLRRAGVEVTVAGVGGVEIRSAHGVVVTADCPVEAVLATPDAVILPGGLPGAVILGESAAVAALVARVQAAGGLVAAICAAPAKALARFGVLDGRHATGYPGFEGDFPASATYVEATVVEDGPVITSRGPGTALEWSLTLVTRLVGPEIASDLRRRLLV